MKIKFLGWGNAWPLNSFADNLYTTERNAAIQEDKANNVRPKDLRYRTSLYMEAEGKKILIDCGPDFAQQRDEFGVEKPDAILLTHEHFDHVNGLADLEVYRRANPKGWKPIPTCAHPKAWENLDSFFGYLYAERGAPNFGNKLLEKINVEIGTDINLEDVTVKAFKTYHGNYAPGSVGYVIESQGKRAAYTSDFSRIDENEEAITEGKPLDVLVMEANWFNEPRDNLWGHMSFQEAVGYIRKWKPKQVYFVHCGDEDLMLPPLNPIINPVARPRDIPKTYHGWNKAIREYFENDTELKGYLAQKNFIGHEGLKIEI